MVNGQGVFAFSIKGIGKDGNSARMTEIFISNMEFIGTNATSKLFVLDAFGAPSRLSWLKKCRIHGFNTVFEAILNLTDTPNVSTLISNFEVCNNEIYQNQYVFNVVGAADNPTFCGLNIHDNCLEWNNNITIRHLFGYNVIKNNLMEGSTLTIRLSISKGRLDFDGNYFEGNTGNITISGLSPSTCEVVIDYIYNVLGNMKLNIGSAYFSKLNNIEMPIMCNDKCVFGINAIKTIMNLPISAFGGGEYGFAYLNKTDANDITVRAADTFQTTANRVPVSSKEGANMVLTKNGVAGASKELAINEGDKVILSYYKPVSVAENMAYIGGSDGGGNYGFNNAISLNGYCVAVFTATRTSTSGYINIGRIDANKPITIGPVTFTKTSNSEKKLKEFAAVENNNAVFYD
jgi:hypothetical protein